MRKGSVWIIGIWLIGLLALVYASVRRCDGRLIYSLDDPYIHLSVAESILQGNYGVNATEPSSPCSSIVYPLMLALALRAGLGNWAPLLINLMAMAGSVYLVMRILADHVFGYTPSIGAPSVPSAVGSVGQGASQPPYPSRKGFPMTRFAICLAIVMSFAMNAWGLVMLGMEHPVHVLAVLLVLLCFLRWVDFNTWNDPLLISAIVVMPLIRFEGLALSLAAILLLWYLKRWGSALIASSLTAATVLGWVLFTRRLGLPVLPSSVLVKSTSMAAAVRPHGVLTLLRSIASNFRGSLRDQTPGALLAILIIVAISLAVSLPKGSRLRLFAFLGVLGGGGHLLMGRYGWFSRYEIYAIALAAVTCLVLARNHFHRREVQFATLATLSVVALPYLGTTLSTPAATQNIYQQQYQMHRFAVDYWKGPVAVNDLGFVSYRNPSYVLDLWGLGSEVVRRMKAETGQLTADQLDSLVAGHGIELVMIYDSWFADIPKNWKKVAVLETSKVVSAEARVSFYATPRTNYSALIELLTAFRKTLPAGASLVIQS